MYHHNEKKKQTKQQKRRDCPHTAVIVAAIICWVEELQTLSVLASGSGQKMDFNEDLWQSELYLFLFLMMSFIQSLSASRCQTHRMYEGEPSHTISSPPLSSKNTDFRSTDMCTVILGEDACSRSDKAIAAAQLLWFGPVPAHRDASWLSSWLRGCLCCRNDHEDPVGRATSSRSLPKLWAPNAPTEPL